MRTSDEAAAKFLAVIPRKNAARPAALDRSTKGLAVNDRSIMTTRLPVRVAQVFATSMSLVVEIHCDAQPGRLLLRTCPTRKVTVK
jgi:hypothetical protein